MIADVLIRLKTENLWFASGYFLGMIIGGCIVSIHYMNKGK